MFVTIIKCKECGTINEDDAKFCKNCGVGKFADKKVDLTRLVQEHTLSTCSKCGRVKGDICKWCI